jgi:hypothetical protein
MTIEEILAKLDTYDYSTFQREALKAAILQQEAITPALLSALLRIRNSLTRILIIWGLPMPYIYSRNFGKNVLIH